jgi:hypothetical protein
MDDPATMKGIPVLSAHRDAADPLVGIHAKISEQEQLP